MQKASYDFESKRLYRKEFLHFLERTYPDVKRRRSLRVVCFPAQEALEVKDVYDRFGIRRDRVYGIERNPEVAAQIRAQNLGINLYEGDARDFFAQTREHFDIVNLDFQSQFGAAEDLLIGEIARSDKVGPRYVLGTNFYGSREGEKRQSKYVLDTFVLTQGGEMLKFLERQDEKIAARVLNDMRFVDFLKDTEDLGTIRDKMISLKLRYLTGSNTPLESYQQLIAAPYFREFYKQSNYDVPVEDVIKNPLAHKEFFAFAQGAIDTLLSIFLDGEFPGDEGMRNSILTYMQNGTLKRPYFISDYEKGRYVSDNGSPMLYDFILLQQRPDFFAGVERDLSFGWENHHCVYQRLILNDRTPVDGQIPQPDIVLLSGKVAATLHQERLKNEEESDEDPVRMPGVYLMGNSDAFYRKFNSYNQVLRTELEYVKADRKDLVPQTLSEVIRAEFESGRTDAEILEMYHLTGRELGGIKAGLRRWQGWTPSHNCQEGILERAILQKDSAPVENPLAELNGREAGNSPATNPTRRLTREEKHELGQLIADGSFSEGEIVQTYNISTRQLAAFKAHLTMGTYRRNLAPSHYGSD